MRSDDFLNMYRELEDSLDEKYSRKKRRYTSVIFEFLNDDESKPIREKLDVCREIRNLLTHNAKMGGESVVEPSEAVCESLKECLEYIQKPSLALEFATRGDDIFIANYKQTAIKIMGIMEQNGFSHVPIMQNGEFAGVFSIGTIFNYILRNYDSPIRRSTTIEDLKEHLPIKAHIENYQFAPKTITCSEARRTFQTVRGKNKRISVIFITENGNEKERLLGMLTPFDVLHDEKNY